MPRSREATFLLANAAAVAAAIGLGLLVEGPWLAIVAALLLLEVVWLLLRAALNRRDHAARIARTIERQSSIVQHTARLTERISPRRPLPSFGAWSVMPDLALAIYEMIREREPELVVELGSGVSTVVAAYALEANGRGRLVSIDHDEAYGQRTRETLSFHGLSKWATVVHAPLRPMTLDGPGSGSGESWSWYSLDAFSSQLVEGGVGLLIVDGPPARTGRQARYPAVPALGKYLAPRVAVVVDDVDREDEEEMVRRWVEAEPAFSVIRTHLMKEPVVLERA